MLKEIMNKEYNELNTWERLAAAVFATLLCGAFCAGVVGGAYASKKFLNKIEERKKKNQ